MNHVGFTVMETKRNRKMENTDRLEAIYKAALQDKEFKIALEAVVMMENIKQRKTEE